MRNMFHVTYDLITPESAEEGDSAENGFVHANANGVASLLALARLRVLVC